MKLLDLIAGLSGDLNDADQQSWSAEQLARWFNEGRCAAFTLAPGQFAHVLVARLAPGTDQELCDCDVLHAVLGITDAQGQVTTPMPRTNFVVAARWTKPACVRPAGLARLRTFSYEPDIGARFMVSPPVMPGEEVYVKVACYARPGDLALGDDVPDCSVSTAAAQWALFRALMVDSEVGASTQAAQVHLQTFFTLLKLKFSREQAMQLAANGGVWAGGAQPMAPRTPATSLGL